MASINSTDAGLWKIGIHGARNSGKTCYLASLYGFRSNGDDLNIGFGNDGSIEYLREKWEGLVRGEAPHPNPKGMPTELRCDVKADRRRWEAILRDYAGELTERKGADEVAELREETREWLKSCNAILFFLDITEPEEAIRERLNELNLLLGELHKLSADGNMIGRPLGLVLTKWDSRSDFCIDQADATTEAEKARLFLSEEPVFGQFYDALLKSGDRVDVFATSAFGSHRANQLPPFNGPRPFNIHSPFVWSVLQSERMVAESAERRANAFVVGKRWSQYNAAINVLKQAASDYKLSKGAAHDQLASRVRGFQSKLRRRRVALFAAVTLFVLCCVFTYYYREESSQYESIVRVYDDPSVSPDAIKDQTERFLDRPIPIKGMFAHDAVIRTRWDNFQKETSSRDFSNLDDFRQNHSSEEEASTRLAHDEKYLTMWGSSLRAAQVAGWKLDDDSAAQKFQARLKHESQYQDLLQQVAALAQVNKYADAEESYHRFLRDFPDSSYRDEVEKRITEMVTAKDDHQWKAVVDFDQAYPNSFDETIKRAHDYLTIPHSKHSRDAERLIAGTEVRWDRAKYEEVCNANRTGADANSVESTQRKAIAYINGTQPRKRMKLDVQSWLDWFNGFQKDQDYYVVVRSMHIPEGSDLGRTLATPECRIQVTVSGRSYWTHEYSGHWSVGMDPVFGKTLGPYRFRWGEAGTFNIEIEGYHGIASNDHSVGAVETDERFIISRLNGPATVRDRNGKDVLIQLECDAVKPPRLPAYKDQ